MTPRWRPSRHSTAPRRGTPRLPALRRARVGARRRAAPSRRKRRAYKAPAEEPKQELSQEPEVKVETAETAEAAPGDGPTPRSQRQDT